MLNNSCCKGLNVLEAILRRFKSGVIYEYFARASDDMSASE